MELHSYTAALGLDVLSADQGPLTLARHGRQTELPQSATSTWRLDTPEGRFRAYWSLLGVRMGLDQLDVAYDPAQERRPAPREVYRHHEVPSVYGDRLARLLPTLTLDQLERTAGVALLRDPYLIDGLEQVYVLETGRHLHTLTGDELDRLPMVPDKLRRDARAALFYDSYRVRPRRRQQLPSGQLRFYETTEGIGASRALILPEYDFDAAQDDGLFAIPTRDLLIVAHPASSGARLELKDALAALVRDEVATSPHPICTALFEMDMNATRPGGWAGELHLPG